MDMNKQIIAICEKNNAQLMIVACPFIIQNKYTYLDQYAHISYLEDYFTSKNIVVYNYNDLKEEINFQSNDLANQGHVNIKGAKKISQHFADLLLKNHAHIFDNCTYDFMEITQEYSDQFEKQYQDFLEKNKGLLKNMPTIEK
jgi:hypothetical protein